MLRRASSAAIQKYTQFGAARLAVRRAEDNLKLLDLKAANQNSVLIRGTGTIALQKAAHDRDGAQKALANGQQKIADLEEQLRRAGGPPRLVTTAVIGSHSMPILRMDPAVLPR